ncbi:aldo/keto reductase [Sphingomonas jatrophae]|uniref:aldo/keto reductase n=1 Tax=Sphingomonas jatrophae TaxID=1166337 RepID=UPI001F61F9A2|nr:aldo/keto reductase [Sphingomonas jatrophae]
MTIAGTDLSVSQLCYGTNMLGTAVDQDRANAILDTFVQHGGNFVDSARMYGDWVPGPAGASERAIGAWLRTRSREGIVVATKGAAMDMRAGDWRNRVTPADIEKDLGESLEHLGIKTIDLYWLHADNPEAPVEPLIDALLQHQAAGRIRYFGASNWSADRIRAANAYAASIGKQGFVAAQPFWGLALPDKAGADAQGYQLHYEGNYETLHAEGLPIIPYAGQSGGYFTKLDQGGEDALGDQLKARYANPGNARRLAAVQALAKAKGVSINEIVLAYLVNQPNQTIPIIGASRPEQIEESVKAVDVKLTAAELAQLRGEG